MVFTIVVTQSQKEATFKNVHVLSGFNLQFTMELPSKFYCNRLALTHTAFNSNEKLNIYMYTN